MTEKIEFKAAVSLQHLPEEQWAELLAKATARVRGQLRQAELIAEDWLFNGHLGSISTEKKYELSLAIYDRLSELMPQPFPEISPAEEEETEETEGLTGYHRAERVAIETAGGLPIHRDLTGD